MGLGCAARWELLGLLGVWEVADPTRFSMPARWRAKPTRSLSMAVRM